MCMYSVPFLQNSGNNSDTSSSLVGNEVFFYDVMRHLTFGLVLYANSTFSKVPCDLST